MPSDLVLPSGAVLKGDPNYPPDQDFYAPADAVAQTMDRRYVFNQGVTLVAGTLRLTLVRLRSGLIVTDITFCAGGAGAAAPTNQWACLVRHSDMAVLAKSADDGATAWAASTSKVFAGGGFPHVVQQTGLYYVGLLFAGTTPPATIGAGEVSGADLEPKIGGISTSGLTNPASLGANAAAISAARGGLYARIR